MQPSSCQQSFHDKPHATGTVQIRGEICNLLRPTPIVLGLSTPYVSFIQAPHLFLRADQEHHLTLVPRLFHRRFFNAQLESGLTTILGVLNFYDDLPVLRRAEIRD